MCSANSKPVLSLQAQMDAQNRLLAEAQRSLAQRETSPLAAESAVVTAPVPREVSVERQAPASRFLRLPRPL